MFRISGRALCLALAVFFLSFTGLQAQEQADKPEPRYETLTLASLSKLYWALSKMDLKNDVHVDNYLMLSECDLFRDFYHNEIEWIGIREAARESLKNNAKKFPVHFEYVRLINLGEYHVKEGYFDIAEEDRILGGRSFEILPRDVDDPVCGETRKYIEGYPKGLSVELNRPVVFDRLYVPKKIAEKYIEEKLEIFKKFRPEAQTKAALYGARDAYVVMKVKILAYDQDIDLRSGHTLKLAKVFAALDGYEIYGDRERKNLMFSEDYTSRKALSSIDPERKKRYRELLKKHGVITEGSSKSLAPQSSGAAAPQK